VILEIPWIPGMSARRAVSRLACGCLVVGASACGGGDSTGPSSGNEPPAVTILSPSPGAVFTEGQAIIFEGEADDPEDGPVSGNALVWQSDVDGTLGSGGRLSLFDLTPGAHLVTLVATDRGGATGSESVAFTVEPRTADGFDIEFRFVGPRQPTADEREEFDRVAGRLRATIVGDLADVRVVGMAGDCGLESLPEMDEVVDDIVIFVEIRSLDGPGGRLAQAGPCHVRDETQNFLPATGIMTVDADDLAAQTSILRAIILHEAFHALGFGVGHWDALDLLRDPTLPVFAAADATTSRPADADRNFGTPEPDVPASSNLVAGVNLGRWSSAPSDEIMEALLSFDLTDLPPDLTFSRAVLQLHVSGMEGAVGREIRGGVVLDPWEEATVTGSQEIRVETPELLVYAHDSCDFCVFDVTSAVGDWISGARPNHGFALFSPESPSTPDFTVGYHSRHHEDFALRPLLWLQRETAFSGPEAGAAFDAIGGSGADVPVENDVEFFGPASVNSHWRESVFDGELMTPAANGSLALSEVTIAAMADLGYEVDTAAADAFSLATAPSATVSGVVLENDVRIAPLVILEAGGARRVVAPSRSGPIPWIPRPR